MALNISSDLVPQVINDYNAYTEDDLLIGLADEVTLPKIKNKTTSVSGMGIAGEVDSPVPGQFESITVDNGSEFALADQLEQSCITGDKRTKVYYCHPYSSWERGSNENVNGMIRRRHPKGTDFSKVTAEEIAATENWINSYPRKIFGYKSAGTMFRECLRELGLTA